MTDAQPKRLLVNTRSLILLRATHALRCICVKDTILRKKRLYRANVNPFFSGTVAGLLTAQPGSELDSSKG